MGKAVNYFEAKNILPGNPTCDLSEIRSRVVPVTLGAVETRKAETFWGTATDWQQGYTELCRLQEALLMPCSDDIKQEIRAGRGLLDTEGTIPPIDADPWTIPLGNTAQVVGSLNTNGKSAAFLLNSIDQRLAAWVAEATAWQEHVARIRFLLEPENELPPDPPGGGEGEQP